MPDPKEIAISNALRRINDGDKKALAEIYSHYGKLIYSITYKMLNSQGGAEECTQDAFVALWKNAAKLMDTPQKVLPWLIRTARNRSIDRLRKSDRRPPSTEKIHIDPKSNPTVEVTDNITALDNLISSERAETVRQAIEHLPEAQKSAIGQAYFHGLTHSEIAKTQGESLGTIKSRIRYALVRLKKELEDANVT